MEGVPFTREQILLFIRYEFHHGKPVEEAFKSVCKVIGNNTMKYHEFQYWYYRFKDGKFDLDHDRNKDPKKPELVDLPVEVTKMIIGKLTLKEKLSLRSVSQGLRETVENMKYSVEEVQLTMESRDRDYWLELDDEKLRFGKWKKALKVFLIMINWPKMKVERLHFETDLNERNTIFLLEAFKSLKHQIPVAVLNIYLRRVDHILAVLPYLKTGVLESIHIYSEWNDPYINLDEVVRLDQWKQAKIFHAFGVELPFESLYHAEEIKIIVRNMSIDDFVKLKNVLLDSPNFKKCYVKVVDEFDKRAIVDGFEDEIIPIPETNKLFEIEFDCDDGDHLEGEVPDDYTFSFKKTIA